MWGITYILVICWVFVFGAGVSRKCIFYLLMSLIIYLLCMGYGFTVLYIHS